MIYLQDASKLFTFMPSVKITTIVILFIMVTSLILLSSFQSGFCFLDVPIVEGARCSAGKEVCFLPGTGVRSLCCMTVPTTLRSSTLSGLVEWATVLCGTPDCLSKVWHITCRVDTLRAARWSEASVRLGPIFCIMCLTSRFTCSLYRSREMFLPIPPLELTNLCHTTWCAAFETAWP